MAMHRTISLRAKILWIVLAINLLCAAVYTGRSFNRQKEAFLTGLDKQLLSAAAALPMLIPKGFHDRVQGPDSISPEEHMRVLERLSRYANGIGITYLYSYMEFDGRFYVATTSATEKELKEGTETLFFDEYEIPPQAMIEAWRRDTQVFVEYADEWGAFRSIFIPFETEAGTRFIVGADVSLVAINEVLTRTLYVSIAIGMSIFIIFWLATHWILNRTLAPLGQLTQGVEGLAATEFRVSDKGRGALQEVSRTRDEIGELAAAFLEMAAKLLEYIANLTATTAAKERFESELKIARDIQMSFLRDDFPPFPERREFDLYAALEPAKEVGGDLYDFFLLDDDHLFFYVGDVSDKSVPAALFMAVSITLLKRIALEVGRDPAEILTQANKDLAVSNDKLLFVTLCCGILNVRTGEMVYSNAGHNPPLVLRAGGTVEWLALPEGLVLAVMPEAVYLNRTIQLAAGDQLLFYTDGVTEAMNEAHELYSEERLLELAGRMADDAPERVINRVIADVREHSGGFPQSDDITVLAVKLAAATSGDQG